MVGWVGPDNHHNCIGKCALVSALPGHFPGSHIPLFGCAGWASCDFPSGIQLMLGECRAAAPSCHCGTGQRTWALSHPPTLVWWTSGMHLTPPLRRWLVFVSASAGGLILWDSPCYCLHYRRGARWHRCRGLAQCGFCPVRLVLCGGPHRNRRHAHVICGCQHGD